MLEASATEAAAGAAQAAAAAEAAAAEAGAIADLWRASSIGPNLTSNEAAVLARAEARTGGPCSTASLGEDGRRRYHTLHQEGPGATATEPDTASRSANWERTG